MKTCFHDEKTLFISGSGLLGWSQKLVESEIVRLQNKYDQVECVVLENKTIEKDWGWVFFYQSKIYIESGNFLDMLGGNAPYIVDRFSGEITETGTAQDIEHYINEYEAAL